MANLFETIMLICFGVSWPVSVYKSWVSQKTGGKSLLFLCLIEFGYLVGLAGQADLQPSYVIAVYLLNILFVTVDIALYSATAPWRPRSATPERALIEIRTINAG
jgi:hypothetical protein